MKSSVLTDGYSAQRRGRGSGQGGFGLVEAAIVLAVVGLVCAMVALTWGGFIESRRIGQTRSQLRQTKDCLLRSTLFSEHFPSGADFGKCVRASGPDAWGNELRWLVGAGSAGALLSERDAVVDDEARGQTVTTVHDGSKVILPASGGGLQSGVAFALVSLGRDGRADSPTYDTLDGQQWAAIVQTSPATLPPDFSLSGDDMVLVVKAYELSANIRQGVGP